MILKSILIPLLVSTLFLFNACSFYEPEIIYVKQDCPTLQTAEVHTTVRKPLNITYTVKDK